jgi:hypothetical protein
MNTGYPWNPADSAPVNRSKGLLASGWQPLHRELDPEFLWHLMTNDTEALTRETLEFIGNVATTLGYEHYTWWAKLLGLFSENQRYTWDKLWNYITPEPTLPDRRSKETLATETPIKYLVNRNSIPIDYVLERVRELAVLNILEILGQPDWITQYFNERYFFYPVDRFVGWHRLEVFGTLYAYWKRHDLWLQIDLSQEKRRWYTLIADDLSSLVNKATYNLAVMLSGYQSRVGKIYSEFTIRQFPADIQHFTDITQQAILDQPYLAVLVHGQPGTGKTAWTQAIAKEILAPLGYIVFILDHDAVEHFVPPSYLERICLIINEADNLAKDRKLDSAQQGRTEHILSLLDGTLYQSVVDDTGIQSQHRLVVLMTCNTTDRLDPAMLRKGRVDLIYEFTHRFV